MAYNKRNRIPGVSGRVIPGAKGRLPKPTNYGKFQSRVPFQDDSAGQRGSAIFREYHRQQVRDVGGRFAGGWGFAWQGLQMVAENLEEYAVQKIDDLHGSVERLKDEMVAYAKENAPWRDRPDEERGEDSHLPHAREAIQGAVVWTDDTHFTIFLGHGKEIYYGVWLEVRWGGKYAIILPTIERFRPEFANRVVTLT